MHLPHQKSSQWKVEKGVILKEGKKKGKEKAEAKNQVLSY